MRAWEDCLARHGIPTAQLLLTAADFDSRTRYRFFSCDSPFFRARVVGVGRE
jgi:glutamate 5-kinase